MQRMRGVAVEGGDVVFLQRDQFRLVQQVEQRRESRRRAAIEVGFVLQRGVHLGQRRQPLGFRVAQQQGQDFDSFHRGAPYPVFFLACSCDRSTGTAFLRLPNRVVLGETPSEQPLPKVKPQLDFSSKVLIVSSRWVVGTTKRSS